RPFAQLNLGTTQGSLSTDAGNYTLKSSTITVSTAAEEFNTLTGVGVDKNENPTTYTATIDFSQSLTVGVENYTYVSMDYLPIPSESKILVNIDAVIVIEDANGNTKQISHSFESVPVQENYRTNIVGNLISSTTDFKVEVNDDWAGADYNEEYVAPGIRLVNGDYEITSEEGLWSLAELVNGGTKAGGKSFKGETIKLTCDIDLEDQPWTPISVTDNFHETFRGTFDGQGYTITGLKVNGNDVAGLFGYMYSGTIQNVIIDGATINSNHYAGGIVGWVLNNNNDPENPMIISGCQVKNSTIASTPEQVNGEWDNGDKVGGIVGYAAYVGGNVLAGDDNTVKADAGILECSVENTTIKAYRDFGGIVGYAKSVKIEQPIIQNVTLEQDLTHNYQATTPTTFGQIIGRDAGGNIVDGVSLAVTVKTSAELQQVVNDATTDIAVEFANDLEGNVTLIQKPGVKITIDGSIDGSEDKYYKYNGSIKVHSNSNHYADAALTIKNVNFKTSIVYYDSDNEPYFNFIEALENGSERYSTNITVNGCTFTATGDAVDKAVALQIKASKNAKALNCTATGLHSLVQAQSCDETVVVKGCTINGKNGVAFKQVKDAKVEGTTIIATGYGIRFDGNIDNYGITVQDNNVTAVQPLIVRKMTGQNNTITLNGENTLTPATEGDYQIVITNGSDDAEYVKPTGTYTLTGADKYKVYPPTPVAKVGNTEYYGIDEAIAAWTNNTTLTLLADVTLSDVVTLKSTEHHILNLGTYTMTAASGKNAFVIKACGTGDAERNAITINADATNPGGINAGSKSIIYYKYVDGGISDNDRPIIKINGGIFTGSTSSFGTAGIYVIGSAARKAATINISGGTFNCSINGSGKSKLLISGGVFHYSVGSQGDSTAPRLISGGRFKSFGFMTADDNNTKFWIGTKMATSDVGVYVDDEGYFVIGGPVITEYGDKFEAMIRAKDVTSASTYLKYSSADTYGLYYTKAQVAIDKFKDNNVEVVIK
ncbi:MAG: hypothetical protein J6U51_00875, partial [Bacteroidales bacterium]|nr:hypothetical protein [Bacteroidales bacterium]